MLFSTNFDDQLNKYKKNKKGAVVEVNITIALNKFLIEHFQFESMIVGTRWNQALQAKLSQL